MNFAVNLKKKGGGILMKSGETSGVHKRYYTFAELYRKYWSYLKKEGRLYCEIIKILATLREYFRYLKDRKITHYTTQAGHVWEHLKYLMDYRHGKGRYYSNETLLQKVRQIYQFHGWVVGSSYSGNQVISDEEKKKMYEYIKNREPPSEVWQASRSDLVPGCFKEVFNKAVEHKSLKGYHKTTVQEHDKGWVLFLCWVAGQGVDDLRRVDETHILEYQQYLKKLKREPGRLRKTSFTDVVRHRRLVSLKHLFDFLVKSLRAARDVTHVIELPKLGRGLPHAYLSSREAEEILNKVDVTKPIGIRDRAILEIFYSTGMRLNELCHLKIDDVIFHEGMIRVDVPKGGASFQRVIPISDEALYWIKKYSNQVRPLFLRNKNHSYLFVSSVTGMKLAKARIFDVVKTYAMQAGLRKKISSHCFRVGTATEMLRHGADIRYVQAQLGHTSLQSTQIYARVLPTDLKKVHSKTHPSQRRRTVDSGVLV